jgi:hypothetical protein
MIKAGLAKLLTVKVGVAVGAAVATGGVALAAGNGALPNPFNEKPAASHSPDARDNGAKGSPSPSLVGLCHAFSAGNKEDRGKSLENPAFTALINAAGGKDKVEGFCDNVLKSAAPAAKPSDAGKPSTRPSTPGTPSPHSKPSVVPSHPKG